MCGCHWMGGLFESSPRDGVKTTWLVLDPASTLNEQKTMRPHELPDSPGPTKEDKPGKNRRITLPNRTGTWTRQTSFSETIHR